jgi:hypothetical protein
MHLSRHVYKKGAHKGEAPAYAGRRGMSHFRVLKDVEGNMRIRMYNTDIITARPDGSVLIDTKGWHSHNTTIIRLNDSLSMFYDAERVRLSKQSVLSYSQPVLRVGDKRFSYYDGIVLSETGEVTTLLQAFEMKRVNKVASQSLASGLQASGFKDAFKILYAMTTPDDLGENDYSLFGVDWQDVLSNNEQADKWKLIIARSKFYKDYWSARSGGSLWTEKSDAKACWATIMQYCKKNMFVVSRSSTYVL